jgi:Fe-S-cluster containining protein
MMFVFFDKKNKLCKINNVKPQQCASFLMWQILIDKPYHEEMQRYMKFCKGFGKVGIYTEVKENQNWSPSDIIRKETD